MSTLFGLPGRHLIFAKVTLFDSYGTAFFHSDGDAAVPGYAAVLNCCDATTFYMDSGVGIIKHLALLE